MKLVLFAFIVAIAVNLLVYLLLFLEIKKRKPHSRLSEKLIELVFRREDQH